MLPEWCLRGDRRKLYLYSVQLFFLVCLCSVFRVWIFVPGYAIEAGSREVGEFSEVCLEYEGLGHGDATAADFIPHSCLSSWPASSLLLDPLLGKLFIRFNYGMT